VAREDPINLRQLRYFIKVVDVGNITRAAEALHVAQPSLGLQMKLLEQELGVELLLRHSRGVEPTDVGKLVYQKASDVVQRVDAIKREIKPERAADGKRIVLGFPPSTMKLLGPDILAEATVHAPELAIELVEERSIPLIEALDPARGEGEIDVVIAFNVAENAKLIRTPIFEEELLFVAAPSFFSAHEPILLPKVLASRLAIAGGRGLISTLVHREADRLSQPLDIAYRIQSVSTVKSVLAKGDAASILPFGLVFDELAEGSLESRRISGRPLYWTVYFVWAVGNPNAQGPAIEQLLGHIAEILKSKLGDLTRSIAPMAEA
jgi:LysR family transcriptional regulator, nitrogen assimilation regulatory protein